MQLYSAWISVMELKYQPWDILQEWMRGGGRPVTWNDLVEVLRAIFVIMYWLMSSVQSNFIHVTEGEYFILIRVPSVCINYLALTLFLGRKSWWALSHNNDFLNFVRMYAYRNRRKFCGVNFRCFVKIILLIKICRFNYSIVRTIVRAQAHKSAYAHAHIFQVCAWKYLASP